jgi:hypothetical protein
MTMTQRGFDGGSYKYGFNGQEIERDLNKDISTALFWEYDTRLGMRWNQDPKQIIGVSPYVINGDNPIYYTDPLGDFRTKFGAYVYKLFHGGTVHEAQSEAHKGEWYVSKRVDGGVGKKGNGKQADGSIEINTVNITDQIKWGWDKENAQGSGGASGDPTYNNVNTGLGAFGIGWSTKEIMIQGAVADARGISMAQAEKSTFSQVRALGASGAGYMKWASRIGKGATVLGGLATIGDAAVNGGWQAHHTADLGIQVAIYSLSASVPVAGWLIGGAYFLGDVYFQSTHNGMSITQFYLDGKK